MRCRFRCVCTAIGLTHAIGQIRLISRMWPPTHKHHSALANPVLSPCSPIARQLHTPPSSARLSRALCLSQFGDSAICQLPKPSSQSSGITHHTHTQYAIFSIPHPLQGSHLSTQLYPPSRSEYGIGFPDSIPAPPLATHTPCPRIHTPPSHNPLAPHDPPSPGPAHLD